MAGDNLLLGEFSLFGLPIAPKGVPKIQVTFDIDANGILHVSAKDRATAKEQSMRVQGKSGLSEAEIQQIIKDADTHKAQDRGRRARAEAANKVIRLFTNLKAFRSDGGAIPAIERDKVGQLILSANTSLQEGDTEEIKAKSVDLAQALLRIGDIIYRTKNTNADRHQLFISYAREDAMWVERVIKSLSVVTRGGIFTLSSDRMIETGSEWEDRLFRAVDQSRPGQYCYCQGISLAPIS